jgi:hypothetical protein
MGNIGFASYQCGICGHRPQTESEFWQHMKLCNLRAERANRQSRIEARFERLVCAAHIHPIRYETIWNEAEGIETFLEEKRK